MEGLQMRIRTLASTLLAAVFTAFAVLVAPLSASASPLAGYDEAGSQPALAETGYDFTPMLITAAVFLVIAGVAVLVAKYALARSSHS
jgi:hypothetical protein